MLEQGSEYGKTNAGESKRVQIEFVSANPTGTLHLGHARGAAFGDALANVMEKQALTSNANIILMMRVIKLII